MKVLPFFLLIAAVGIFLFVRKCVDRKVEAVTGKEVVREGEELLGSWATKTPEAYLQLRFKRDGSLEYLQVVQTARDTTKINGTYQVDAAAGRSSNYYPRLYGFGPAGDTLFNYYLHYITPYSSTDKYDKLVLNPNSLFDTVEYKFYRIKQ